ncbi:MAG: ABC transporter permease [Dehalococcoidia bacterium]|nr:MAG: ABC transporter permease [Dehalococcoidia bacterium]
MVLEITAPSGTDDRGAAVATRGWLGRAAHLAHKKPLGAFGAVVMVLFILAAVFADAVAPYSPLEHGATRLAAPSSAHLAGTDQYGRDVLSRVVFGARTSLYVGVVATILSMVPAVLLGMSSAFFGGWYDYLIQRFVDTIQALPGLVLLITILVILGPGLWNVIIALSFNRAIVGSRVMRGATMAIKSEVYIEAAHATGATNLRLILRHLLPNIAPTIIVVYSLGFGTVILSEASLSFLGYGIPPPTPSWGGMLAADGRSYMFGAPWMLWAPTLALAIVIFAVNMFGDAIRDLLDPRMRGAG